LVSIAGAQVHGFRESPKNPQGQGYTQYRQDLAGLSDKFFLHGRAK